jgi:hypothetical protein
MYQLKKNFYMKNLFKSIKKKNELAFIVHPKVSAVKYFPLELIKPNDQQHFSDIELFDWIG